MFPPCSSYDRLCGAVATLLRPHWLGRVSEDPSHSGRGCRVSQGPPTPPRPCLIHPLPSHQDALSKTQRGPQPFLLTAFPGLHPLLCRGRCPGVCPGSSAPPSRPVSGSQPAPSLLFSAGTQASHTERNPDPSGCLSPLFLSLPWSWRLCWSPPCLPLCCELPSLCSSISCVLCASSRVCSRSRTRRGQDQRVPRRTVTPAPPPGLVCAGAAGAGLTVPGAALRLIVVPSVQSGACAEGRSPPWPATPPCFCASAQRLEVGCWTLEEDFCPQGGGLGRGL